MNRGNKWEFKCWSYGLKPGLILLLIGQYLSLLLLFVHYLESLWKIFLFRWNLLNHSSQESKGGAVVRALTFHQCGLGSNLGINAICGLWLFVYRFSLLLREVFLQVIRFSPLIKNQHFQMPIWPGIMRWTKNHLVEVLLLIFFIVYLLIYLFTGY